MKIFYSLTVFAFYWGVLKLWLQQRTTFNYLNISQNMSAFRKIKDFSHIRFSIALTNSLKSRCLIMVISGQIHCLVKLMFLLNMLTKFGICLDARILLNISCCISKLMSFFWLKCLKNAGDHLIRYTDYTPVIALVHPIFHGMQC